MFRSNIDSTGVEIPLLVFTLDGDGYPNPRARMVIESTQNPANQNWVVFDTLAALKEAFKGELNNDRTVAVFDHDLGRKHFKPMSRSRDGITIPSWSQGSLWGVAIGKAMEDKTAGTKRAENCAQQIAADFAREFEHRIDQLQQFPWGRPRKGEAPPVKIVLPEGTSRIITALNEGPDMIKELAPQFRSSLPKGQRFSWIRVPGEPAEYCEKTMLANLAAFEAWEFTCAQLVAARPEIGNLLMEGVKLGEDTPELRKAYLYPRDANGPVMKWSVRRPDMHVNGNKLVASENDEMPGGFFDLVMVDLAYGINQEAWQECWDYLFSEGPLVFVVSNEWSAAYIESTKWLVGYLRSLGRSAHLITTPDLDKIEIKEDGAYLQGERIGTIWRQFPVFETKGKLAQLVFAAQSGKVRMVPEFAHFGNKTWFSIFWENLDFYKERMSEEDFTNIVSLLPRSHLINFSERDFPFRIGSSKINSVEGLMNLPDFSRAELVLKVTGANDQAARSYGVFIGYAHPLSEWQAWLLQRSDEGTPFIIQERFETSKELLPVYNTETGSSELFRCKVLLRPWMVGGKLVSSHNCCTPHWTTKVHGMKDMAVAPIKLVRKQQLVTA